MSQKLSPRMVAALQEAVDNSAKVEGEDWILAGGDRRTIRALQRRGLVDNWYSWGHGRPFNKAGLGDYVGSRINEVGRRALANHKETS